MKDLTNSWDRTTELTRFDRVVLHVRCLLRDHKYGWHFAGIWRELTLPYRRGKGNEWVKTNAAQTLHNVH